MRDFLQNITSENERRLTVQANKEIGEQENEEIAQIQETHTIVDLQECLLDYFWGVCAYVAK